MDKLDMAMCSFAVPKMEARWDDSKQVTDKQGNRKGVVMIYETITKAYGQCQLNESFTAANLC